MTVAMHSQSLEVSATENAGGAAPVVAVAVKGNVGDQIGGSGSRRAVRWAVENLLLRAQRFVLVHVIPPITSIPTPSGERIPVGDVDKSVAEMYVRDMKLEFEQVFVPFKKICKPAEVETLLLEHEDPGKALLRHISAAGVHTLVMGSFSANVFSRRPKGQGVPSLVLRYAPETCEVYVVFKDRIVTKSADPLLTAETRMSDRMSIQESSRSSSVSFTTIKSPVPILGELPEAPVRLSVSAPDFSERVSFSGTREYKPDSSVRPFGASKLSQHSYLISQSYSDMNSLTSTITDERWSQSQRTASTAIVPYKPVTGGSSHQSSNVKGEVERLKRELQDAVAKYKQTREKLVQTQDKIETLSSMCLEEARKVHEAVENEQTMRKAAAVERERYLRAMKEVEVAKAVHAKEFCERKLAEVNALKQYIEKKKIIDRMFASDWRYRRYSREEIEKATDFFHPRNVIGEGGYGKVYKCSLDHTPVAIKVLRPDSLEKKEEFLKEVEILSQLRHPHVVLLLGACPENGCLVYEFLDKGSLEDHIFRNRAKKLPRLPPARRFRIIFEVACGLAFLHASKPEPVVHRDLKPANILLDRNLVTKIGDVGLAKLVTDIVPDNVTAFRHSVLAGTLYYMDPEYQRTGTVRPKSDLYAFGIIVLQVLTARPASGILSSAEESIKRGKFAEILDKSVMDWPMEEAEEVARIGLRCSQLRCRDRPDLQTEVLPALKRILDSATAKIKAKQNSSPAPAHYFCPILREIMEDPHIAADGFTYEHRAMKEWLARHGESPVTKQKLKHSDLTPNNTLRAAIQEWRRSRTGFSS